MPYMDPMGNSEGLLGSQREREAVERLYTKTQQLQ